MKAEFSNPFVTAGIDVLESVIDSTPEPGQLAVRSATVTTQQVSVVIGVTGPVEGKVVYGMSVVTATKIAAAKSRAPTMTFDEAAGNALAELGNGISEEAKRLLSEAGYECQISEPEVVRGRDMAISTTVPALVVPLYTDVGRLEINIALEEAREEPATHEDEAIEREAEATGPPGK